MPLRLPSHPSITLSHVRNFSCTAQNLAKSTKQRLKYEHETAAVPPYPYGASQFYKQSNFGLYGRQKIRYGNMVSERNEIKTRRYWRPNVQVKRIWSDALQHFVKVRITTRVLRTVDKCGGLDEYLLGEKAARIKELGMGGWKLRWRIMQTDRIKEKFRLQREILGLPPKEEAVMTSDGKNATKLEVAQEIDQFDAAIVAEEEFEVGDDVEEVVADPGFMREEAERPQKVVV